MGLDLVEAVKGQLSPALLGRVGSAFGMSPDAAAKAAQGALPKVVDGISSMAGTERGASKLMAMLPRDGRQADGDPLIAPLDDINEVSSFGQGALGPLFGDKLGGVVGSLSQSSGLGASNAKGILGVLTSLGLGVLGRYVRSNNLNAQGLGQLLGAKATPRDAVPVAVPATARAAETVTPVARREVSPPAVTARREPSMPWARWLLPAVLVVGALALFRSSLFARRPAVAPPPAGAAAPAVTSSTAMLERVWQPGSTVELPYRIPLDLHYETGSAEVPAAATTEIASLGKALAAHPSARVQVLGHTDESGGSALNQQLSERRAGAVRDALVSAGASPSQIEARGAGADAAAGSSAASRATNIVLTAR
jgi:outer membrane protein OmpA-like peptidoglycan-associated protein